MRRQCKVFPCRLLRGSNNERSVIRDPRSVEAENIPGSQLDKTPPFALASSMHHSTTEAPPSLTPSLLPRTGTATRES
ncbi:hypothetical protein CLOM_g1072 [Closterium sp. NIES-68]|nr:hypothetical protein CLOM_g1072 [Closterium sp. NIES-68]GJP84029.1 hypothetical protein CLOP_g14121 [Closterium sp. NIES-67]